MRSGWRHWLWAMLVTLWAAPPALAATEPIAVIVHPGRKASLSHEDLTLIYRRKKLIWPDGSRIQPVNLPTASPLRRAFSREVLGQAPEALTTYWNDMYFHGVTPPYVLGSPEAVLRFVAETPAAVGYVPYCSADSRVSVAVVLLADGGISENTSGIACPK